MISTEVISKATEAFAKNPLPGKITVNYSINYSDFERWFKTVFGKTLEIACTEECGNDTTLSYDDIGNKKHNLPNEFAEVEAFVFGNGEMPNYSVGILLDYLCQQGFIASGNYRIEVSW